MKVVSEKIEKENFLSNLVHFSHNIRLENDVSIFYLNKVDNLEKEISHSQIN
jgi:hypothetical protein